MKQLSALGARRHAFFRSPRRMRPLVDRLEPGELIPNGPFSFYGGGYRCSRAASLRAGFLPRLRPPSRPVPRRPSRDSPQRRAAVLRCRRDPGVLPLFSRCFRERRFVSVSPLLCGKGVPGLPPVTRFPSGSWVTSQTPPTAPPWERARVVPTRVPARLLPSLCLSLSARLSERVLRPWKQLRFLPARTAFVSSADPRGSPVRALLGAVRDPAGGHGPPPARTSPLE